MKLRHAARFVGGAGFPERFQGGTEGLPFMKVSDLRGGAPATVVSRASNYVDVSTARRLGAAIVPAMSILIPKIGAAIQGRDRRILVGCRVVFDNNVLGLVPAEADPRYLAYVLYAADLRPLTNPGAVPSLDLKALAGMQLGLTQRTEQRAVADFLDRECARIEALIERIDRMVSLRRELDHAWRDGKLDAHASRFGRLKLGWFAQVIAGYAFSSSGFVPEAPPGAVRLLRGVNVGIGATRWEEVVGWPSSQTTGLSPWALRRGDLVMGMDRPWIKGGLRVAALNNEDLPAYLLQRVACIRPFDERLSVPYLRSWLERDLFRHELGHSMTGVAVPHISGDQIKTFKVSVPPREQQDGFIEAWQVRTKRANAVADTAEATRLRLTEYRNALITEAVTGQLDVSRVSEAQMDGRLHAVAEGAASTGTSAPTAR